MDAIQGNKVIKCYTKQGGYERPFHTRVALLNNFLSQVSKHMQQENELSLMQDTQFEDEKPYFNIVDAFSRQLRLARFQFFIY